MEQRRGAAAQFQRQAQQRIKRQDRRFVLGNMLTVFAVPRDADFRPVHAASIELDGNRLGDRHRRPSVDIRRISSIRFAPNLASAVPINACVRGTLAQRVTARIRLLRISIYVSVGWILLRSTYRC